MPYPGSASRGGKDSSSVLYNMYLIDKIKEMQGAKQQAAEQRSLTAETAVGTKAQQLQAGEAKEAERITKETVGQATGGQGDVGDFPYTSSAIRGYVERPREVVKSQTQAPKSIFNVFGSKQPITTYGIKEAPTSINAIENYVRSDETAKQEAGRQLDLTKIELEARGATDTGVGRRLAAGEYISPKEARKQTDDESKFAHTRAQTQELQLKTQTEQLTQPYNVEIKRQEAEIKKAEAFIKSEEVIRQPRVAEKLTLDIQHKRAEIEHLRVQGQKDKIINDNLSVAMDPKTGPLEKQKAIRNIAIANGHGAELIKMDDATATHYINETERAAKLTKEANTQKDPEKAHGFREQANVVNIAAAMTYKNALLAQGKEETANQTMVDYTATANVEGVLGVSPKTGTIRVPPELALAHRSGRLRESIRTGQPFTLENGEAISPTEALIWTAQFEWATKDPKQLLQAIEKANVAPELKDQAIKKLRTLPQLKEGEVHEIQTGRDVQGTLPLSTEKMPKGGAAEIEKKDLETREQASKKTEEHGKFLQWLRGQTDKPTTQMSDKEIKEWRGKYDKTGQY